MNTNISTGAQCAVSDAVHACRRSIWTIAAFSFCENLLVLAAPLYMMQVYDRVLASRSGETLLYLTLFTVFTYLILGALDLARARLLAALATWLDHRLAPALFERAVQSRLKGRSYGPEALNDLGIVKSFVSSPAMAALFDLPWSIIFVIAAYLLHPYIGLFATAAAAVLVSLALTGEWLTRRPLQILNEAGMISRQQLESTARNAEVIEAMGMMPAVAARWLSRHAGMLDLQAKVLQRSTFLTSATKVLRLLVQTLSLGLGAWLVIEQSATGGVMIASSILLTRTVGPIEQAIGAWKSIVSARTSFRRLRAFNREPAYRPSAMSLPTPTGALCVEKLVYKPPNAAAPILKGVSFELEPGESLAIVGPSGSGKSTLASLLVGAVEPTSGLVRLDGADIFGWDREHLGQHVGYLPQGIELFAGTVSENIARMGEVNPADVVAAARTADVHELILRMPNGYQTEIGERGQHLSAGQRQRIALARAVLRLPRLVVLDEPNSNLDGDGDLALARTLAALRAAGSTVVVISHRTALIQHVDKILVLRNGQVDSFASARDVVARLAGRQATAIPTGQSIPLRHIR